MSNIRVIILAAGKGTRMKSDIPKPLISVAGKPMIEHLLESVRASGVDERPVVVVGAWSEALFRAALGDSVDYAVQREQLGTGHAVRVAQEAVGAADNIIVLYGDHPFIRPEVIKGIADMCEAFTGSVVMLTAVVPDFIDDYTMFERWGRILRDDDGEVIGIREAKDCSQEELEITEVNPGIYAFPAAWAWSSFDKISNENASKEYYLTDLIALAVAEGIEIATASADPLEVVGINSPEELARAERIIGKRT
ncbi:MAG: Bifunctional protein GlmU [Candidatus Uhrbacteria bacterium GW2011_GWD2_52_7]|uniref:Bifunctional protein GlmU n=1 Tax=Candidatus Uhrbacteria bacterium GW2011_GWD2_52_7 TaxID=1618989 RepID=A0A0G1XGD5_9BACT|nr:MAG: Bifunctional protein GlmU [Candidatus Uhrbacteria bacterium GW2011_GWD2_52_7]